MLGKTWCPPVIIQSVQAGDSGRRSVWLMLCNAKRLTSSTEILTFRAEAISITVLARQDGTFIHGEARKKMEILQIGDIGHTIQLAIAPVFLLTGVGTLLAVLTNRLGRIIDRSRRLEDRIHDATSVDHADAFLEIETLYQRAHLINRAITLSTCCGLLVCLVIAALFVGDTFRLGLAQLIALMFVFGMLSLIGSFVYLLREIFVATRSLPVPRFPGRKG
jgi:hypothetical protein